MEPPGFESQGWQKAIPPKYEGSNGAKDLCSADDKRPKIDSLEPRISLVKGESLACQSTSPFNNKLGYI